MTAADVPIPFFNLESMHQAIRAEALEALAAVYDSNWYILGEQLRQFEQAYAAWQGARHTIGVASGLDALHIALKALGIARGQEVIVPSNTYIATWLAVSSVGATIVPAEPDPHTWNLDPAAVEAAITPRTAAVLPVHLFGQACRMDALMALARRNGLMVVEDNAQAHGARCKGQLTGSFGQVNATSFYPTKNLGALGDAGALTTDSDSYADFARSYRNYGSAVKYRNEYRGINSRLDEMQAALLSVKLRRLDAWNQQRAQLAERYLNNLNGLPQIELPRVATGCTHVWHLFVIQCTRRDALQQYLSAAGIQTLVHYPMAPHLQKAYETLHFRAGQFPVAEQLARNSLSLPLYPGMPLAHVDRVCAVIRRFCNNEIDETL